MQKNTAGQKWTVFAFDSTTNLAKTGDAANITAKIRKDWGAAAAIADTNPTEVEDGFYDFDLTQAETNADMLHILPESSTSNIVVVGAPSVIDMLQIGLAAQAAAVSGGAVRLGITAALLNSCLNPSQSAHGYWVGAAVDGAGGTGSGTVWTDNDASWVPDQWNDFYLVLDGTPARHLITDTKATGTALVSNDSLTGLSGAYEIRAGEFISTADAFLVVERVVGEIKSMLPEKYREMLYKIEGEVMIDGAYHDQSTASLTYETDNKDSVHLWRNYSGQFGKRTKNQAMYSPLDVTQGLVSAADYTISTANSTTTITFQLGGNTTSYLSKGDVITAEYTHALPTVPPSIKHAALNMSCYEILRVNGLGEDEIVGQVAENKARSMEVLEMIRKGEAGIDEFDKIMLYSETRVPTRPGGRYSTSTVGRS